LWNTGIADIWVGAARVFYDWRYAMEKRLTVYLFLIFSATLGIRAETCQSVEDARKSQLESFVKQWYKLPNGQTVMLVDSASVDYACYRKLVFRASVAAPLLTLYLTPDGKHLVTGLMDLTADPAITQRKRQDELQAQLASGAFLTSGPSSAPAKDGHLLRLPMPILQAIRRVSRRTCPGRTRQVTNHIPAATAKYSLLGARCRRARRVRRATG
jgi:hypothetical protein